MPAQVWCLNNLWQHFLLHVTLATYYPAGHRYAKNVEQPFLKGISHAIGMPLMLCGWICVDREQCLRWFLIWSVASAFKILSYVFQRNFRKMISFVCNWTKVSRGNHPWVHSILFVSWQETFSNPLAKLLDIVIFAKSSKTITKLARSFIIESFFWL